MPDTVLSTMDITVTKMSPCFPQTWILMKVNR